MGDSISDFQNCICDSRRKFDRITLLICIDLGLEPETERETYYVWDQICIKLMVFFLLKVMLISLLAGGVGLNLTGGNHLFLLDMHW